MMSRRRSKTAQSRNQPFLRVRTEMLSTGRVEVDPAFNRQAIENLDQLYQKAGREDYDLNWDDDHKIAYFLYQIFEEILLQYEPPADPEDIDPAPGVPHISENPVRDVVDIAGMTRAGSSGLN